MQILTALMCLGCTSRRVTSRFASTSCACRSTCGSILGSLPWRRSICPGGSGKSYRVSSGAQGMIRYLSGCELFRWDGVGPFWFVHGYLTSVLERSLPGSPGLYHLLPCPPLSTEVAHKVGYIDNFGGVSGSEALARLARDKVLATLTGDGVVAVVEDDADPLLGCQLTRCGRGWMPVAKRFWKCAFLAAELGWGRRRFTGLQVATALGHINSIFLLQRPLFAIFSKAYIYASHYEARCRYLWPSVREEFRLAWMMLPAARSSCGIPWSQCVSAVDASLHGFGLCETQCSAAEVMDVGLVSERCRFRGLLRTSRRPRDSAIRGERRSSPDGGAQVPCLDAVPESATGGGPSNEGRLGAGAPTSLVAKERDMTMAGGDAQVGDRLPTGEDGRGVALNAQYDDKEWRFPQLACKKSGGSHSLRPRRVEVPTACVQEEWRRVEVPTACVQEEWRFPQLASKKVMSA